MPVLPDPRRAYPITLPDGSDHKGTVFLNEVTNHPRFEVGAFSYASDFDPPEDWVARLAPYLFPFSQEKLRIGRFCQIAHGVRFITSSANHAQSGLSCYPFPVFDPKRQAAFQPDIRDTVIGHDVWLGYRAMVLPGANIGHGAIIGAGAVIRGEVPAYAIMAGNPGVEIGKRFDPSTIERLLDLAWWNWGQAQIYKALPAILHGDLTALAAAAP